MSDIEKTFNQAYKDYRLQVRLDHEERAMLEAVASRWGVTLAGAIRRLIREDDEKKGASYLDRGRV